MSDYEAPEPSYPECATCYTLWCELRDLKEKTQVYTHCPRCQRPYRFEEERKTRLCVVCSIEVTEFPKREKHKFMDIGGTCSKCDEPEKAEVHET